MLRLSEAGRIPLDIRKDLLGLPQALRETIGTGGPEYDELVRKTRWGDGPVYVIASGGALAAAWAGAYGFETLVGVPAMARTAADFQTYALIALRPRAILLVVANSEESAETVEAARAAKSRGATVLALTSNTQSDLGKIADGAFLVRDDDAQPGSLRADICRYAAACYLAFVAARALKRPDAYLRDLEQEFAELPDHIEWVFSQLSDAVRALSTELETSPRVQVAGGGFYFPAAMHGAEMLRKLKQADARAFNALGAEFRERCPHEPGDALLLLSGSRCRGRKLIHALAEGASRAGPKLLALTDKNDPEVSRRAALAILLPVLSEEAGSLVSLALLAWVACHGGRKRNSAGSLAGTSP